MEYELGNLPPIAVARRKEERETTAITPKLQALNFLSVSSLHMSLFPKLHFHMLSIPYHFAVNGSLIVLPVCHLPH